MIAEDAIEKPRNFDTFIKGPYQNLGGSYKVNHAWIHNKSS